MKILVTGAKGFVGRNLCAQLKNIRDGKNRTRPNIKIDKIQYYFTMDLAQNEEKLEKSFYNFVEEKGKYKFNNPEIKILD